MSEHLNPGRVSNPASTGGAGMFFEQHVAAYWLAQLLVRGIPPIFHNCAVVEVHLQTEHLGWHTDDFLIIGQSGPGDRRKLAGQVKRSFTVSATDVECKKAMEDFWKDFKDPQRFSPGTDRFALVTLRGTNTLLEHFSGLLDSSRVARDAAEFERRLATPGFISAKAIQYRDEIQKIIGDTEGRSVSAADIWSFLRVLHVLSLDLNTATRQTEAMIKTLLAHTTGERDAIGAADASWNALLREVGEGMPRASSYQRGDLPEVLRQRHSLLGETEQRALRALNDHSALILGGIRSTIGSDLHLGRDRLVQQVIEQLESTQIVLISGPAGSGKSAVAKDAIGILATDYFAFSFRAEEFAHSHFDETLQSSQIPATAVMLGSILASEHRKVLLVESVERLLEKSTRDAFTDLLTLVGSDRSWSLILTCRDYSADLVRTCFLGSASISHSVITVPPLDDREVEEVAAAYPTVARPFANAALRRILQNPYVLDKALQIRWSEELSLPQSEREFRSLFWQEMVRADHRMARGMPHRREDAFVQIALRRAQALTLYAACGDLDPEALDNLRHDSLIMSPEHHNEVAALAHDVLEDWAILRWIEEQYVTHDCSVRDLCAAIGTYPAVRRTYRKWVAELVERDPAAADRLFQAAVREPELRSQFRDDTLVSLLRSPSSATFLDRHSADLFANDKQLLRRVLHLLRVACVTAPAWVKTSAEHPSLFNMPDGLAWACVLRLVQTHLQSFTRDDCSLLLGFIEDWARGVSWQNPYPEGAQSVAVIAHWLLSEFDDYPSQDQRKRTLQVIAKIPNADRECFATLLRGSRDDQEQDRVAKDLREIIFEDLEGMPAARDMPEAVVATANDYLLCSEADLHRKYRKWGYMSDLELETLFGIKLGRSHGFFPASAYRGPFLPLLRHHPGQGLDFIIGVLNHSADWYAHPRVSSEYVEPPFEMTLTFADGTSRTQWCNARLWNLYRGTSVGPYVLQCLLMALERWLLEVAEARPHELDKVLLHILQRSESVALAAVVASVATAFPNTSGETLLVLLRSRLCVVLDRQRLGNESQAASIVSRFIPQLDSRNEIYKVEREQADALSHRHHDLETAIANLQLGPLASRVHEILDRQRAEMPSVEEQNEDDRMWRLAMHRMDLRQYTVAEDPTESPVAAEGLSTPGENRQFVRLELKAPEPDIKEMVDQNIARLQPMNARLNLLMWGLHVFRNEEAKTFDPGQWPQRLREARTTGVENSEDLGGGGPGFVAVVCIRDHWEEMSSDEQDWCVEVVCSEVESGERWDQFARVQLNSMSSDRPSAWVLPLLLGKSLPEAQRSHVSQMVVVALTHAVSEVRWYAALGVSEHLWSVDRELTLRCVNALATEARLIQEATDEERSRLLREKQFSHTPGWVDQIEANVASIVRQRFFEENGIPDDALETYEPTRWFGAEASGRILTILGQAPAEPAAIQAFQRMAQTLVEWWGADDGRRRGQRQERPERNHETESALSRLLQNFLLRTSATAATAIVQPILDAVDRHPREVSLFLLGIIGVEDREPNTPQFWLVWELFVERVRRAWWLGRIDDEYATGNGMISAIFLGTWWKEEVRHWRSLEGQAHHVHGLFEDLPTSSTVLDDYIRFLYHIGEQSLPDAFISIAKRLQQGDPTQMMRKGNTVFLLEILLQRYVYARPLELKRRRDLREAVLLLLDLLVENGSSAAFRMRDDFVTPISL